MGLLQHISRETFAISHQLRFSGLFPFIIGTKKYSPRTGVARPLKAMNNKEKAIYRSQFKIITIPGAENTHQFSYITMMETQHLLLING